MASITDNPEEFFNELTKPKEEKPSVEPVKEKPVSEEKPAKQAAITEDPTAFFSQLEKPVEAQKPITPQSVFLGQIQGKKPEQLETFDIQSLNQLAPDELHDVAMARKDLPLTDEQLRSVYDYHKTKAVTDPNYGTPSSLREFMDMTNRWVQPLGKVGNEVAHTLWSAAKGAGKLGYATTDYALAPTMLTPEERAAYTPEQVEQYRKAHKEKAANLEKAWQSAVEPIVGMPEELSWMGNKLGAGGFDWYDRASEALGLQDHEKSFQNFKARRAIDSAQAQYYMEHPSAYGRLLDLPIVKGGLEAVVKSQMPSASEWQASHPDLNKEQAQAQLDEIAKGHVDDQIKQSESRIVESDPDIATFGTFAAPEGLGMGTMGALGMGAKVAGEIGPRITQGLKYLGKTDAGINAMNVAEQALNRVQQETKLAQTTQPSILEKGAGKLAEGIDWTGAKIKGLTEKIPEPIRPFVPYVAGGAAGGIYGHEEGRSVLGDIAHGIEIAGLLKAPAFARDVLEARRISAGGTKGTFETLGGFPEVSEGAAKVLRFGGKNVDRLLDNAAEYAKAGIHGTALAIATGALDSADPDTMNELISNGLIYSLGGHAFERIKGSFTGRDPILEKRKAAQRDVDNLKTYADLSPETRQTLDGLTDWNDVVQKQQKKTADAQTAYQDAVSRGTKNAADLGKDYLAQQKALSSIMRANVQTRNEYARGIIGQLSDVSQLANGSLRAGQNNVGIHILTTKQIFDHFRKDPANAGKSDAEVMEAANQRGFYSTPDGAVEYTAGMGMEPPTKDLVFDRTKPSVVVNADHMTARGSIFNQPISEVLNHEIGHHLRKIPEFREANKDAEAMLFSQEVKDANGNVVAVTSGRYSPKDLVEMYEKNYMKNKSPQEIEDLSKLAGLWDYSRQALDENAVADYMRDEIIADLNAGTISRHLGKDLDSGTMHLLDVASLKTKKNLLDRAIQKFYGLGGKGDATSQLTGANYSPEVLAANRQAIRALQSLQGEVSPAVAAPETPKISRAEMMKNRGLMNRYGKDSGMFKTKVQAQIFNGNGKPVGAPIDIANPNAAEGTWLAKDGQIRQSSGYGQRPDEVSGINIPDGGSLVVGRQIVTQPDGVTPVLLTQKESKALQKSRAQVIRQALDTPDYGAPNRFEPTGDPDGTWRGTFTPLQIEAIKNLPEGIIPRSIKENMLKINDAIVRGDGSRLLVDYAAVMDDNGRYKPYAAKIYDVVPIGMHLSKDGHILSTNISVGRLFDKLNKWSERMPARLAPWGGSKDAFFKEFTEKYLQNWQNGVAGETGLAGTHEEALAKKNIFNDFLNLATKDTAPLNPDRTKTPRRRGDVRGKDIDRTIMSMRLDHMAELIDNDGAPKVPVSYQKAKFNLMPAEEPPAPREEERKPSGIDLGITAAHSREAKPLGAQYVPPTQKYPTSEQGFYSGLQKTINEKMPAKASPEQILSIVNNPQNAKPEEVKWSNLAGFLEGKKSVTKEEVLDYLKNEGSVKFEEVILGQPSEAEIESLLADEIGEGMDRQDAIDYLSRDEGRTQYAQYTLPNGENYREVVLTMPKKPIENKIEDTSGWSVETTEENKYTDQRSITIRDKDGNFLLQRSGYRGTDEDAIANLAERRAESSNKTEYKKQNYTSSHFPDIPNYVAHMRLNERPDSEGRNGLFIEEIQSDRHQQGREKGYVGDNDFSESRKKAEELLKEIQPRIAELNQKYINREATPEEQAERTVLLAKREEIQKSANLNWLGMENAIPDAPFRKDWPLQMFKRALRDAIASGKEWIGWTSGDTQAERYDLSKQVSEVRYNPEHKYFQAWKRNLDSSIYQEPEIERKAEPKELEDLIGKDLAKKLIEGTPDGAGWVSIKGQDLKVGGEGMKGFYDQILPKEIGKYVKKWGAKVEEGSVGERADDATWKVEYPNGRRGTVYTEDAAESAREAGAKITPSEIKQTPIWKVKITPEMREGIQKGGQLSFMPAHEEEPERITEATYTNLRTGKVSRGATHTIANPNAPQEATDRESPAYGFATDKGRIVDRNEAYNIAQAAGQLKTPATEDQQFHADRGVLHSDMVNYEGGKSGIAFMPASKLDKAHAAAIESGDTEEAQRLVDEAARKSAPYVSNVVHHWSKTNQPFNVFDITKGREAFHFGTQKAAETVHVAERKAEMLLGEPEVKGKYFTAYLLGDRDPIQIDDSELNNATSIAEQLVEKGLLSEEQYKTIQEADKKLDTQKGLVLSWDIEKYAQDVKKAESDLGRELKNPFEELKDALGYSPIFEYVNHAEDVGSISYISTDPSQIKSADPATYDDQGNLIPLSQRFNPASNDIRFMPKSEDEPKNLVAVHNTSAEKIANALKIGGFAVPSVAIIRNDRSQFDSFGDITLVAPKGLINPEEEKKSKVFNADVYSPRYPSVSYSITDRKAAKSLRDSLVSAMDKMPENLRKKFFVSFESEQADRPMSQRFAEEPIFMAAFLSDTGRIKDVPFSKVEDRYEQQSAKWDVREYINSNPELKDEFNNWLAKTLKDSGVTEEEKLFAGYTPSGNRRYLPHTIENVVKMMTKSIRDGEGFNYGVGSIRSKAAKQFRTMKGIEASRESIIPKEEMERLKDEVNNEFENIVEESAKQRANQGRGGFVMDAVSDDIKAFAEGRAENMKYLREMYPDGAPYQLWRDYLEKLRGLPTEYFEAKIQRGVDLNEFAGAVVPEGTSQELINKLEKKGLEVVTYPKGDKAARAEAVKSISGKQSDIAFMPQGQTKEAEPIDWTAFTQKTEKPLSTIRAYAVPQQQKDESY